MPDEAAYPVVIAYTVLACLGNWLILCFASYGFYELQRYKCVDSYLYIQYFIGVWVLLSDQSELVTLTTVNEHGEV